MIRQEMQIGACRTKKPMLTARLTCWIARSNQPPSGRSSGVEHNLAKVGVEGSNPFARSSFSENTTLYSDFPRPGYLLRMGRLQA